MARHQWKRSLALFWALRSQYCEAKREEKLHAPEQTNARKNVNTRDCVKKESKQRNENESGVDLRLKTTCLAVPDLDQKREARSNQR